MFDLLQSTVFPLLNIAASCFTASVAYYHYTTVGRLSRILSFSLPIIVYFGLVYTGFLIGVPWLHEPSTWLRGPVVILLIAPGIFAYIDTKEYLNGLG